MCPTWKRLVDGPARQGDASERQSGPESEPEPLELGLKPAAPCQEASALRAELAVLSLRFGNAVRVHAQEISALQARVANLSQALEAAASGLGPKPEPGPEPEPEPVFVPMPEDGGWCDVTEMRGAL